MSKQPLNLAQIDQELIKLLHVGAEQGNAAQQFRLAQYYERKSWPAT